VPYGMLSTLVAPDITSSMMVAKTPPPDATVTRFTLCVFPVPVRPAYVSADDARPVETDVPFALVVLPSPVSCACAFE